jgi:hypothetical protein
MGNKQNPEIEQRFVKKYGVCYAGEKGLKIRKEIQKDLGIPHHNLYNLEYIKRVYDFSEEEGKKFIQEFKKRTSVTLENMIKKYGKEEGTKRYNSFVDKSKSTIENYKERYGDDWEDRWQFFLDTRDSCSIRFFKEKYREDWQTNRQELLIKLRDANFIDRYIEKYGEKEGTRVYNEIIASRQIKFYSKVSRESKDFFKNITDFLKINKISYAGVDCKEMALRYYTEKEEIRYRFYDLYIPCINTVIEYQGYKFHAPLSITKEEKKIFRTVYSKLTWEEQFEIDQFKRNLAIKEGLCYLEFFPFDIKNTGDSLEEEKEKLECKIKNLVMEQINENKENS